MTSARAPFRIPPRATAVAVTVLTLAVAAHVLAGGELPAFPVMTALAAVVALSAVMLAGRKMTAPPPWPHILALVRRRCTWPSRRCPDPGRPHPPSPTTVDCPGGTGSVAAGGAA